MSSEKDPQAIATGQPSESAASNQPAGASQSVTIDLPGPLAGESPVESAPVPAAEEPSGELKLTAKAVTMVRLTRQEEGMDESYGLRVAVRGGGCSGFEYALDFEERARPTDHVIEYEGLQVFVDPVSSRYLAGTTIDYHLGMSGTGFKFENPQATGTCGCGSSFAV